MTNAELLLTLRQFRSAIKDASSNLTLPEFCAAIDNDVDEYARDKYADFRQLGALLANFSTATLERLIAAELARPVTRREEAFRAEMAVLGYVGIEYMTETFEAQRDWFYAGWDAALADKAET